MHIRKKVLIALLVLAIATPLLISLTANKKNAQPSGPVRPHNDISITATALLSTATPDTEVSFETEPEDKPVYSYSEEIPLSRELQVVMQQACEKYGVPYALALAVAECESSFRLEADNGTCWGVMQIHPINYPRLRENGIEPTEYEGNITAGVFMLGELLEKYSDTHKALMAYNCGETGAKRLWKDGYMTTAYSVKVVTASEKWLETFN